MDGRWWEMTRAALGSEAVGHGWHACGIVGSGCERLRMVSWFVRTGLAAGDRVWCFPNGSRSEVLDRLHREDVACDDDVTSGQLTVTPTHESVLSTLESDPDGVVDGLRQAVDDAIGDGWSGFRMVGDLGWATRGASCVQRLLNFEERVTGVLAGLPAALLCQYDRYRFDATTMTALTRTHAAVVGTVSVPAGEELTVTALPGRCGLRLSGEVDLGTHDVLTSALDEAVHLPGDLHLDLSDLTFIDVGGVQVIAQTAQRLGPDRRMLVYRPPQSLGAALELLWDAAGLVVVEERQG